MSTSTDSPLAASLAADPFTSLAVHYGMLLGVPDFEVMAANPRGKLRLHNGWLHGPGVVWGFGIGVPADHPTQLEVEPGLALDGVGREVALVTPHCVDVPEWLAKNLDKVQPVVDQGTSTFNVLVVLRHRACLARPVPAMSSGCDAGQSETAFSRVLETAELELRPYVDPPDTDERDAAFARLRALLRDGTLPAGVEAGASWLEALRQVVALDTVDLHPPGFDTGNPASTRLFPADEPGEIVLADLRGIQVTAGTPPVLTVPSVDLGARTSHVPTWVIEELVAELLTGQSGPAPATDAGGPRVASVAVADAPATTVALALTSDVVEGTLAPALEVQVLDASAAAPAWAAVDVSATLALTAAQPNVPATVTFDLPAVPTADTTYRVVLRGTGPTPLVAMVAGVPVTLAGRVGGPAGSAHDGHDVTHHITG